MLNRTGLIAAFLCPLVYIAFASSPVSGAMLLGSSVIGYIGAAVVQYIVEIAFLIRAILINTNSTVRAANTVVRAFNQDELAGLAAKLDALLVSSNAAAGRAKIVLDGIQGPELGTALRTAQGAGSVLAWRPWGGATAPTDETAEPSAPKGTPRLSATPSSS